MNTFSTNAFRFTLPGDGWMEKTAHFFRRKNDPTSQFAISRVTKEPDDMPLESLVELIPEPVDGEKEVLRSELRDFGAADAEDVSVRTRFGTTAIYHHIVSIPYYQLSLSFQWTGPFAQRDAVDASVERTLSSLRFWDR